MKWRPKPGPQYGDRRTGYIYPWIPRTIPTRDGVYTYWAFRVMVVEEYTDGSGLGDGPAWGIVRVLA